MAKTVDELIDESLDIYIFISCKDHGHTRDEFNPEYLKETLLQELVDQFMEQKHPRNEHLG